MTAALEYAAQNIQIIPCKPRSKKPALKTTGAGHATAATTSTKQIQEWWTTNPNYNIGIPCGPNQLAVIDIDGPDGEEWMRTEAPPLGEPRQVAKTGKGWHIYYRWPADLEIRTCEIAPQVEIRAAGSYVIATHPPTPPRSP
jgi:hypothetical protein